MNKMRARRGARLLDTVRPDWFMHVDAGAINVKDKQQHVLGQVYGSFSDGLYMLGIMGQDQGIKYGFRARWSTDYVKLNQAWAVLVRRRQDRKEARHYG